MLIDGLVAEVRRRLAERPGQEAQIVALNVVRDLNATELLGILLSYPRLLECETPGGTLRNAICAVLADRVVRRYSERD